MTIRKKKQQQRQQANGLKAPPTIREESPSPAPSSQPRKLSTPELSMPRSNKAIGSARKLSDSALPNFVSPKQPEHRKISLGAALSGAPTIDATGALVHKLDKATMDVSNIDAVDSDTEDHIYFNIDPQQMRELQRSPFTSDSEAERDTSISWNGISSFGSSGGQDQPPRLKDRLRQWERRLSSDSEDGISSPTRRPIATPRAKKPDLKPKPTLEKVPPRPRMSQIDHARRKAGGSGGTSQKEAAAPKTDQQPHMPKRPRGTEIRRARQVVKQSNSYPIQPSQSPTPSRVSPFTPTITATNDKGDQRVVHSSPKSAFKPISNRRSPSLGLAMVREERSEDTGTTPSALGLRAANHRPRSPRAKSPSRTPSPSVSSATSSGGSLAPSKPARNKDHEIDTKDTIPSPSSSPASSPMITLGEGGNPFNQQMAETLIKYVLASQDTGLKNALRDCIMSNPEAVKALKK